MVNLRSVFFLFPMICFFGSVYSQKPSIYGIPFGSTFSKVESILDQKLFIEKFVGPDNSILEYHDANMAGVTFGSLIISFSNGVNNIMTKAEFSSCYKSNTLQLKKDREIIAKQLAEKYTYIQPFTNPIGYKSYKFGFSEKYIVGVLSVMVLRKSQSSFGVDYYYLDLTYSPKSTSSSDL